MQICQHNCEAQQHHRATVMSGVLQVYTVFKYKYTYIHTYIHGTDCRNLVFSRILYRNVWRIVPTYTIIYSAVQYGTYLYTLQNVHHVHRGHTYVCTYIPTYMYICLVCRHCVYICTYVRSQQAMYVLMYVSAVVNRVATTTFTLQTTLSHSVISQNAAFYKHPTTYTLVHAHARLGRGEDLIIRSAHRVHFTTRTYVHIARNLTLTP